jgi:hypothetical protein
MNRVPLLATLSVFAAALSLAALPPPALAADPATPAPSAAPKPTPKPPPKKRSTKKPAAPPPAPETPPPAASAEQMQAATRVLIGEYGCEFNQKIMVERDTRYEGYVNVVYGKDRWVMRPVVSPVGAIRLEEVRDRTLMVQIAYKSMLMDVVRGQRLVDDCVHETQAQSKRDADKAAADTAAGVQPAAMAASATPAAAAPAPAKPAASSP